MTSPILSATFQTTQFSAGVPTGYSITGGTTIFDSLASPPAAGVAAADAIDDKAEAVGTTGYSAQVATSLNRHYDPQYEFYDAASILPPS